MREVVLHFAGYVEDVSNPKILQHFEVHRLSFITKIQFLAQNFIWIATFSGVNNSYGRVYNYFPRAKQRN